MAPQGLTHVNLFCEPPLHVPGHNREQANDDTNIAVTIVVIIKIDYPYQNLVIALSNQKGGADIIFAQTVDDDDDD